MAKAVLSEQAAASTQNIYQLDGKVPLLKAIPFGLQHILAMFVANLTPITLIGAASGLDHAQIAVLLQNAMFVAGIATLIQLYPIWKIGSRLPVVMGVSFTFVTILSYVGTTYGYPTVMGAVLIGGLIEGTLGLLAKYWRKIITPVVAASVVTAIGYSLFTVGTRSFGGGYTENFGSPSKPAARYDYAGGMPAVQYLCKRLLEAAFGAGRSYHRLSGCTCHGYGRPQRHLFGRLSFAASSSAVFS